MTSNLCNICPCKKTEKNKKRPSLAHFLKKETDKIKFQTLEILFCVVAGTVVFNLDGVVGVHGGAEDLPRLNSFQSGTG